MTVAELSAEVGRCGVPMAAAVLYKLEQGKRPTVSVSELLALGRALRVAPLLLAFPIGRVESVEVLPGQHTTPLEALLWVEGSASSMLAQDDVDVAALYRDHEAEATRLGNACAAARSARARLDDILAGRVLADPQRVEERLPFLDDEEQRARRALGDIRDAIATHGLLLPDLPDTLGVVDVPRPNVEVTGGGIVEEDG